VPPDEPSWWYVPEPNAVATLLRPAARLYWRLADHRHSRTKPWRCARPVICVGNFTAGGTGKTPLTLLLAERLEAMGQRPAILTRGYGGRERGPVWVDPGRHTAREVGDEALLLARAAPTLVCRDRAAGARAIEADPCAPTAILMDDGLQNPALVKDLSLAVVDARRGIGNAELLPAGPLRAPIELQLALVDAVIVNEPPGFDGATEASALDWLKRRFQGPVLSARPTPEGDTRWLEEARVVAFAGIANPDRFFALAKGLGANLVETIRLPDHHAFRGGDARRLLALADDAEALLVTTEKDHVRLAGRRGSVGELRDRSRTIGIRLALDERDLGRLDALIKGAVGKQGQVA
jgi:tetraacyldisaccharide 4'-kinase